MPRRARAAKLRSSCKNSKSLWNRRPGKTMTKPRFFWPRVRSSLPVRLGPDCRTKGRIVHFNVTAHPTSAWVAQQLREAFPFDQAPRYLIRDRDGAYGNVFRRCAKSMGIEEVLIAPQSPWQNP